MIIIEPTWQGRMRFLKHSAHDTYGRKVHKTETERLAHVSVGYLAGDERHAPPKNCEAPGTGERWFLKSRGAVLRAPHSPHPLPTSPISRLLVNTAEPSSLKFQYSKCWTLASVSEAFQELRGQEELSQQLSVNSEEMPLISLHQKAIFRRTSRQGGEAPKMEIYRHLEAKVPQSKTSGTEKMLEKEFSFPGATASHGA